MVSANRRTAAAWRRLLCGTALVAIGAGVAGCGSSAKHAAPPPSTTLAPRPTPTTLPGIQTSGPRTVLSPIGVNVRATASRSSKVLGTADWGTVLTVLGHNTTDGLWFEVRGAAHTGWIEGSPVLSAPGEFATYSSSVHLFSALYPPTWTDKESPPSSVIFSAPAGADTIVATTAATASRLPVGRAGYGEISSRTALVCGVTGDLVTYSRVAAPSPAPAGSAHSTTADPYLLQIRLTLDPHHALGFDGNLSDLGAPLQAFNNFLDSVSFPTPQCIG